jgi:hypothetical protein
VGPGQENVANALGVCKTGRGGLGDDGRKDSSLPPKSELKLLLEAGAGAAVLEHLFRGYLVRLGRRFLYLRWNGEEQVQEAWDGMKMWVKGELPNDCTPQPMPKKIDLALMIEKFEAVLGRGYISAGLILSLTVYFEVQKRLNYICLVYDGTRLGLNAALWAPSFWMPNAASGACLKTLKY